jgi:hypothetical protein
MPAGEPLHESPERAARAIAAGRVLAVKEAPDRSMTVVVLAHRTLPVYVLCERRHNGWAIIDYDDELDPVSTPRRSIDRPATTIVVDVPVPASASVTGESSPPPGEIPPRERTTWFSTEDDEALDPAAANIGVEITRGAAPPDTVEALLRDGRDEFRAPVESGVYWFVRWAVPDPDERDEDGIEVVAFRRVDDSIVQPWRV